MGFLRQSRTGSGSLHPGRGITIVMHFVHWLVSTERVVTRVPGPFFRIVVGLAGSAGSWWSASEAHAGFSGEQVATREEEFAANIANERRGRWF